MVRGRTFSLEEVGGATGFIPPRGYFFFFFLSWFFYPLAFYCLFSLLTSLASRDFCENVFLVLGVKKKGKSIFCAKERDVSLPFVRSTAAILTNNTQALLHV